MPENITIYPMNNLKLLLASWGLSTEPIIQTFEEMVGKPRNRISDALFKEIITRKNKWNLDEINKLFYFTDKESDFYYANLDITRTIKTNGCAISKL